MKSENAKRPVASKYSDVHMSEKTSETIKKYYYLGHLSPCSCTHGGVQTDLAESNRSIPLEKAVLLVLTLTSSNNEPHSGALNSC